MNLLVRHSYQQKSIAFTYNMGRPHVVYGHVRAPGAKSHAGKGTYSGEEKAGEWKENEQCQKHAQNGRIINSSPQQIVLLL